jgi:hypothetical protein
MTINAAAMMVAGHESLEIQGAISKPSLTK